MVRQFNSGSRDRLPIAFALSPAERPHGEPSWPSSCAALCGAQVPRFARTWLDILPGLLEAKHEKCDKGKIM